MALFLDNKQKRVGVRYTYTLTNEAAAKLRWLRDQQQALIVERRRQRGHGTRTRASYQQLVCYLFRLVSAHMLRECAKLNIQPLPMTGIQQPTRTTTQPPKTKVDELT